MEMLLNNLHIFSWHIGKLWSYRAGFFQQCGVLWGPQLGGLFPIPAPQHLITILKMVKENSFVKSLLLV